MLFYFKQRLRCQHKEPCRLFTVRKRRSSQIEEVNASPLCQCPKGHKCPRRHTDPGSLPARSYAGILEIKTYSGYCVPSHHTEPAYNLWEHRKISTTRSPGYFYGLFTWIHRLAEYETDSPSELTKQRSLKFYDRSSTELLTRCVIHIERSFIKTHKVLGSKPKLLLNS